VVRNLQSPTKSKIRKLNNLLVIGPLPPPVAGTSVSFKLFCDFLENQTDNLHIKILNTAPKKLGTRPLLSFSNLSTTSRILWGCLCQIQQSNKVLLFGSNQFLLSLMPICLLIAKLAGKPFYVRSFGGSLDTYYLNLSPIVRRYFYWVLKHIDGLIVQTQSKKDFFNEFMGNRVHLVPGYRESVDVATVHKQAGSTQHSLKLVYVGHIRKQKGVFDLLDSINLLNENQPLDKLKVTCDLFGPVYEEDTALFNQEIANTTGANYGGVLEPVRVIASIASYDAFVFPTYYQGEGHPGVLIEAMMAGLPVITTNFKSIPDLIEHASNGLLVPPKDPTALADAIDSLCTDKALFTKLKDQSAQSGLKYRSTELIPLLLKAIEVEH